MPDVMVMDPSMNEEMMKVGEEVNFHKMVLTLRWSTMMMQTDLSSSKGAEEEGERTLLWRQ